MEDNLSPFFLWLFKFNVLIHPFNHKTYIILVIIFLAFRGVIINRLVWLSDAVCVCTYLKGIRHFQALHWGAVLRENSNHIFICKIPTRS